jgi:hypothetical protein
MKLGDILHGLAAMRRLKRLEDWYDKGYDAFTRGDPAAARESASDPDEQTAYTAGWIEAKQGRPRRERTT